MAVFPMEVWFAFVTITSWFCGIASVTTTAPSAVYIGKPLLYLLTDSKPVIIQIQRSSSSQESFQ